MGARLMGFYLTVEQGDHLPGIAHEHGFSDWRTIWDDPNNAELRRQRTDAGVLAPGDRLYIPDKKPSAGEKAPSGSTARFRVKRSLPRLRLIVRGFGGKPLASTECKVTVSGASTTAHTGADGLIEIDLAPDATEATLEANGQSWTLKIGHLDPPDTDTGLWARLRNLGYLIDEETLEQASQPEAGALAFAIELFQRDHQLTVDGSDVQLVKDKLREIYGC
jgi:N-acetylmuramoyl-L-alanine amidase